MLSKTAKRRMPKPKSTTPEPVQDKSPKRDRLQHLDAALSKARYAIKPAKMYSYEIKPPDLMPGVVPNGVKAPIAMDSAPYTYAQSGSFFGGGDWVGFPGYPYLSMLSTRPEYRAFAQALATQITREWITLDSTDTAGDDTKNKITELTQAMEEIKLKDTIYLAVEHDSFFGRAQILHNLEGHDLSTPLKLTPQTIKKREDWRKSGLGYSISAVEAMWTTPNAYNAIDPSKPDFYQPSSWFMLGKLVHATRLQTIITRPVADMLKPAFNFGGISQTQLAEPYVDNWLRTRTSVADLISNFSIIVLATAMDQALQGDDVDELIKRIELFTLTRNNRGAFVIDKDREEMDQIAVPLGGLAELQSQSQEQMCAVGHTPAVILLGIAPTGFGNVAEGEIRTFYDWIRSIQEAFWHKPIKTSIDILQLLMYGEIDPDIIVNFEPLYQMTPKELAEIRTADAATDTAYVAMGAVDNTEVRIKLARDPESGYQGIDTTKVPEPGNEGNPSGEQGQEDENEDL